MTSSDTVEVLTGENPVGSVIWLHGLGADGHDFEPIVPELRLDMPLRFIFPHAPVQPVTINGGMAMRAWYDIKSLDSEGRADADGVRASGAILESLIEQEIERGIPVDKIVIAGFSQGGAIAIHTMLNTQHELAGVMALSTYLAVPADLEVASSRKDIPLFMAHGTFDPMLPLQWGQITADHIRGAGYDPQWHEYPMQHAVCPQEIADISEWLKSVFG